MLVNIGRTLKALATQYQVAVVCTNYTVSNKEEDPAILVQDEGASSHQVQKKQIPAVRPALGTAWYSIPNTRFILEQKNGSLQCTLDKTTHIKGAMTTALLQISSQGVSVTSNG